MDKSTNISEGAAGSRQPANHGPTSHPTLARESSNTSLRRADSEPAKHPSQSSVTTSASTSANASPLASRDTSPIRPTIRSNTMRGSSTGPSGSRSRKNSQQDNSPSRIGRPASTNSRTISASTTPTLLPATSDSAIRAPVPQKPLVAADQSRDAPRWPISPRLRSPPPILNRPSLGLGRKGDQEPPTISVQRSTPSPHPQSDTAQSDSEVDDAHLQPGTRTPRAVGGVNTPTLETVQEASPLGSPQILTEALEKLDGSMASDAASQPEVSEVSSGRTLRPRANLMHNESGSESGSVKADRRSGSTSAPPPLTSRQSSTSGKAGGKGKPGEGSLPTMTVETETVTSIPEVSVALASAQATNGSLRANTSNETIRPKKDKKKSGWKQPAVAPGTASSKADIFEAKVANAVDEADTSDSEETFVYDSNPPDGRDRPHRFHSRTPSATSMASQADRNGMRSIHSVMDGPGPTSGVPKKNMKFVNTFNSSGNDSGLGDDEGGGRINPGSGRGTARHHHHLSRWPRNGPNNGHPSLFDNDGLFPASAAKSKLGGNTMNSGRSSGPPSPGYNSGRGTTNGKRGMPLSSGYDLDETTGADDERTPLITSIRSNRHGRRSRPHITLRSLEHQSFRRGPSLLNRFATCLVVTIMIMLVISGAIGLMFATSQPLEDVTLIKTANIIASEQELLFDIMVRARNPNVVVVTIDNANVDIFVHSRHAGTDSEWWRHPHKGSSLAANGIGDIFMPDDPPSDADPPKEKNSTLALGSVQKLDNPLSFEGAFFHGGLSASTAGIRLERPLNGTDGGSERWERILEDDFTLIIRVSLNYYLPLSQRMHTAILQGETKVKPNTPTQPGLRPNSTDPTML